MEFIYAEDRKDLRKTRLAKINIYLDDIVKEHTLNHSYLGAGNTNISEQDLKLRMLLESIDIKSKGSSKVEENYKFRYNQLSLPPYLQQNNETLSFSEDYWGYYNGANNRYQIPKEYVPFSSYSGNRESNDQYIRAGILEGIQYPTGGKRTFEYELNDSFLPGLRIKSIVDYNHDNIAKITEYKYGNSPSIWNFIYNYDNFSLQTNTQHWQVIERQESIPSSLPLFILEDVDTHTYFSNPIISISDIAAPFYYDVEEHKKDASNLTLGYTSYHI